MNNAEAILLGAVKAVIEQRRAADARRIAAAALAEYEKEQKVRRRLKMLERLPSSKPMYSQRLGDESAADAQKRLYNESRG